ncbi:sensor histidine kinase [Allobaculum sp. JKK-2023]|uniref:sensor histidine kinase n=1 Tax=Allobaculum sp. JKK-2023 TaxID=3108943 RepID=UPI002B052604|nr:sensor histidine kinase [Allobaculum sp. JKK-2023]
MKRLTNIQTISALRNGMITLNYIIVMFFASVNLLVSREVIRQDRSHLLLETVEHLPKNPDSVFWICLVAYALLAALILSRVVAEIPGKKANYASIVLEILLSLLITWQLNLAYSGLYLLVFSDCLFHMRREKKSANYTVMVVLVLFYFLSNYYVISFFMPMTDPMAYFSVPERKLSLLLVLVKNVLEVANLLMFVAYLSLYIAHQTVENENIAQELDMINQVNKELRNYAAVTERIGENNERKRLAREIHDTLGHALTGIAAGVDATLIIIDKSPDLAKKQLELVSQVVREGINDVRNSLNKLRPGALENTGLKGALQKMISEFVGLSKDLSIDLDYEAEQVNFEVAKEDALFRVIQESLTNSIRHGLASHVYIRLYIEDNALHILIEDNGQGCLSIQPGYGLTQMKERIAALHGAVQFDGSDGFTTSIVVPMQTGEYQS